MKKNMLVLVLVFSFSVSFAQKAASPSAAKDKGTSGVIAGGVGMSWIKNDKGEMVPYYLINLSPEIAFMNFGVGLDLNLYVSSKDQSIRWQELQRGRFIRYLRYGNKGDEIYARVGILDYARLGHGSILYNYRNSPSVDNRRIGTEFDLDFGKFGLETVYGDITDASVLGARGYVRPLQFTPAGKIPVIGGVEVGATYATDIRDDAGDIGYYPLFTPSSPTVFSVSGFPFGSKENAGS